MPTKFTYIALVGAFCLAVVGTATTLSDSDGATVVGPPEKETVTLSQRTKEPKSSSLGKSDSF